MPPVCPNGNLLSPALFLLHSFSIIRALRELRCAYSEVRARGHASRGKQKGRKRDRGTYQLTIRSYGSLIKQSRQPGQLSKGSSRVSEGDSPGFSRAFVFAVGDDSGVSGWTMLINFGNILSAAWLSFAHFYVSFGYIERQKDYEIYGNKDKFKKICIAISCIFIDFFRI